MTSTSRHGPDAGPPAVNEVHLVGRVSGPPDERVLPRGDELIALRIVVPRVGGSRRGAPTGPKGPKVDTIDATCWSASTRRVACRLAVGDTVQVAGALRRRFFRTGAGAQSRYDVEVTSLRRVASA
ncbi:MAG TPA: single-stranded DNA-binding protein [Candidatus Lustribacter sp.]|nr:single-stranded DNA-binding protein [Candidatus Lustribacter sp.]